jgi:hypothetical protein
LWCSLKLAFSQFASGHETKPHFKEALAGLWHMFELIYVTGKHQGPTAVGKVLKQWTTEAQAAAVGAPERKRSVGYAPTFDSLIRGTLRSELTTTNLWVFSGLGRSIPAPMASSSSDDPRKGEYLAWAQRLWSVKKTDPSTLNALKDWTRTMVTGLRMKTTETKGTLMGSLRLNRSACLENSRAKGGAYGFYVRRIAKLTMAGAEYRPLPYGNPTYPEVDGLPLMTINPTESYEQLRQATQSPTAYIVPRTGPHGARAIAVTAAIDDLAENDLEAFL